MHPADPAMFWIFDMFERGLIFEWMFVEGLNICCHFFAEFNAVQATFGLWGEAN